MWGWLAGLLGSAAAGKETGKSGAKVGGGLLNYVPEALLNAYADVKDGNWEAIAEGAAGAESDFEHTYPQAPNMSSAPISIEQFHKMFGEQQRPRRQFAPPQMVNEYLQGLLGGGRK